MVAGSNVVYVKIALDRGIFAAINGPTIVPCDFGSDSQGSSRGLFSSKRGVACKADVMVT